jgi:hypothetical protein
MGGAGEAGDQARRRSDGSRIEGGDRRSIVLVEVIPKRSDNRSEGQAHPPDRDARAAQDPEATLLGLLCELVREPRLPDAGLAGDQEVIQFAPFGSIEGLRRSTKLLGSADEDRADGAAGHVAIIGALRFRTRVRLGCGSGFGNMWHGQPWTR